MGASRKQAKSEPECLITVRVLPRASRIAIEPHGTGTYRVKLTSPPIEGEANIQLIEVLSEKLSIAKSNIEIVAGAQSRTKRVRIVGLSESALEKALQ